MLMKTNLYIYRGSFFESETEFEIQLRSCLGHLPNMKMLMKNNLDSCPGAFSKSETECDIQ